MADRVIAKGTFLKSWNDGYWHFEKGEVVDLTDGYEYEYAILVPSGIVNIDLSDDIIEIKKINGK